MIFFIVTTSVFNECPIRKSQYIRGITQLTNTIKSLSIESYKIIVVENNGARETFLDTLCSNDDRSEVFYTKNNLLQTKNKGRKELQDVKDCIAHYGLKDQDFIVKMTGRYILQENSEFMNSVKDVYTKNHDCIIRYGSYSNPASNYKTDDRSRDPNPNQSRGFGFRLYLRTAPTNRGVCGARGGERDDCITGLIGMKCGYIKQIELPKERECVEWKWSNITRRINTEKIRVVTSLGINVCPGTNNYVCV